MNTIKFYDFIIVPGKIDFKASKIMCGEPEHIDELFFYFNREFIPHNDLIALALSTLCAKLYAKIHIDLAVTVETISNIEKFTKANITTNGICSTGVKQQNRENVALSFSGGFDSLAAYCIMPENTQLLSIDFGHWYQRETDFFEKFDTSIVSTNFRRLNYDKASWTFMGIAAILYSELLGIAWHIFGTIMDGSAYDFLCKVKNTTPMPYANLNDLALTRGLTEIGTAMIISHYRPDLIQDSLVSLGSIGTEKRYRKTMIMDIVSERYERNISCVKDANDIPVNKRRNFGEYFCTDLVFLYIMKHRGLEAASKAIDGIPKEAALLVESLTLEWYEKLNPSLLNEIPETFRERYLDKLDKAGIALYSDNDWREYEIVLEFMSRYHSTLKKALSDNKIENPPRISVIIPVYNAARYLREWLDSIVNQVIREIEIICIDDGSTDNSKEILREYTQKDSRVRVITQDNRDFSAAVDSGIQSATGEYVLLMDSVVILPREIMGLLYHKASGEKMDILYFGNCDSAKEVSSNLQLVKREQLQRLKVAFLTIE